MRILHIITRMIVGGAQENTLLTCEGLHAMTKADGGGGGRKHEVILLTGPSPGPEGSLMARAEGAGYQVLVTPHLVRSPHVWHDPLAWREIKRLCRDLRPDVVHTHSSKAGILGRDAAWHVRKRQGEEAGGRPLVVHTIHGLPFHPYQNKLVNKAWIGLERYAAKRCDGIICVADAMTRQTLAEGIGRPEQFTTIYSGMEIRPFTEPVTTRAEIRARYGIPEDRVVFATIARLQPLKGHDDLLAGIGAVLDQVPNAHWLWIGDGIFRERLEQKIKQGGWQDRFTFTGLVPPARVPELLPGADVVVHPSYREGLARALPQGLLAGKAIISYDCDGAGEVCILGKTGILVKTGDVSGLTEAMIDLGKNSAKRHEMGVTGRALCIERFSADVMVQRIEEVYQRLAASV